MEVKYISLFDYLGKPAGKEVGARVNQRAREFGILDKKRFIRNKKYTGKVNLYPEAFLDYYFTNAERNTEVWK